MYDSGGAIDSRFGFYIVRVRPIEVAVVPGFF